MKRPRFAVMFEFGDRNICAIDWEGEFWTIDRFDIYSGPASRRWIKLESAT